MVGVPGKSKGCVTCRRRKKGCDKQAPFCGQCIAAGLVCEGYPRHDVWINSYGVKGTRYTRANNGLKYTRKETRVIAATGAAEEAADKQEPVPNITLHDSLARTARQGKYVGLFLTSHLPNGQIFSLEASQLSPLGWMRYHDDLCRSEKTLGLITLAASLSMLGARDADGQLAGKGLQAYGMAVQEMTVALGDPRRSVGDGLLASVRLMRLFEIMFGQNSANPAQEASSPQVDGYFAHTDGEMALFMKRGKSVIDTEVSRQLYADGRLVSFILGTTRRQNSLFSRPEWTSIPWDDLAKTPHDKLLDAIIQLPGLLEDLDAISAHADPPDPQRQALATEGFLCRSRQVEQQLLRWKRGMGHQLDKFDFIKVGSGSNMPTAELDNDFALIHLSCLFWGACLLLYSAMEQVQDLPLAGPAAEEIGPDGGDGANADNDATSSRRRSRSSSHKEDERSPSIHASRIAHCIGQMFQPRAGNYGAMAALFPLGITLRYLRPGGPAAAPPTGEPRVRSQEWTILKELFSRPFMGTYVGRFLSNLRRQDANPAALYGLRGGGPMGMEERAERWWNIHVEKT